VKRRDDRDTGTERDEHENALGNDELAPRLEIVARQGAAT
jgi:hypothetical protein